MKLFLILVGLLLSMSGWSQSDSIVPPSVKSRGGAIQGTGPTPPPAAAIVDTALAKTDSLSVSDSMLRHDGFVRRFFTKGYPNPRKAALMSLVIPGAGQAYNRKWWKIPLVYGALGGLTWWEIESIKDYKLYKTNYKYKVDDDPLTVVTEPKLVLMDAVTLKANREIARKNLERSSLVLGLGYLLSVTDAFVDAHMATFDISDDLSLKICPKTSTIPGIGPTFGLGILVQL